MIGLVEAPFIAAGDPEAVMRRCGAADGIECTSADQHFAALLGSGFTAELAFGVGLARAAGNGSLAHFVVVAIEATGQADAVGEGLAQREFGFYWHFGGGLAGQIDGLEAQGVCLAGARPMLVLQAQYHVCWPPRRAAADGLDFAVWVGVFQFDAQGVRCVQGRQCGDAAAPGATGIEFEGCAGQCDRLAFFATVVVVAALREIDALEVGEFDAVAWFKLCAQLHRQVFRAAAVEVTHGQIELGLCHCHRLRADRIDLGAHQRYAEVADAEGAGIESFQVFQLFW